MKTLVDIDAELLEKAMRLTGVKTKKETIHTALLELVRACQRKELISLKGSNFLDLTHNELYKSRRKRTRKSIGM
ncbi:type II toxin-antitoxin system VapB family antitoxin [bacterium]|nr:type II toxin-antitoxin system VapB family antitoxin [bacterium]